MEKRFIGAGGRGVDRNRERLVKGYKLSLIRQIRYKLSVIRQIRSEELTYNMVTIIVNTVLYN